MKLLIFGAGALGGVLGALLSRDHDVSLVTRGEHLREIQKHGLRLEGVVDDCFEVPAFERIEKNELFDGIFITTKSYDTETAAKCTVGHLNKDGCIVTVQNGIGNAEMLSNYHDKNAIVVGVTSMGAYRVKPGIIRYVSSGGITLGTLVRKSTATDTANGILRKAGIATRLSDNITGVIWSKAIVNAAINPITAIHGCENGRIISDGKLNEQAKAVCEEGMRVAAAKNIPLDPPDVVRYMTRVAMSTAKNRSSMLIDIERRKRTEIDAICGPILRYSAELGIGCPVMSRLYSEVKSLERRGIGA